MNFDLALISPPLRTILSRYLGSAAPIIVTVLLTTILAGAVAVSAPYLFSRLVDQVAAASDLSLLLWAFFGYAVLMGLSYALQRLIGVLTLMTAETLNFVSSTAFFERLVEKTTAFFLDHNPAEIESAQQRGAGALNVIVQFLLAAAIPGLTQIVLSLALLGAVVSLDIAAIVIVYGVLYITLVVHSARKTHIHLDEAIDASQDGARFVGNAIGGMDTLRQFGSDRWMIEQFSARQKTALERWRNYAMVHGRYALLFGAMLTAQFGLTLFLLVPRVNAGLLTIGDLVLFNTLLLQLNSPFQMIGQAIQQFAQSHAQFVPFARMWQAQSHADTDVTGDFRLQTGKVTFENVGYLYPNGRGVEATSFTALRGTITYITGDTGAGKSTLFKLLLKSMPPQTGAIRIDGADLNAISRSDWFSHTAAVPQDIVLLNDTLATNIVLGRPHDGARLRRAAERAAILDFIDGLEDGFQTVVGERGLKLSGGERQRIAIARALYADPAIVLLDEASSALDAQTEKDIMDQLRRICDQVTIIAITHRLSVIGPNDQVVRIGPPVAEGDER